MFFICVARFFSPVSGGNFSSMEVNVGKKEVQRPLVIVFSGEKLYFMELLASS